MMDMEALVILSNVDGVYSAAPDQPGSELIRTIHPNQIVERSPYQSKSQILAGEAC